MLAVMTVVPFFCYMLFPSPYDTITAMISNLAMIFVFRTMLKNLSGKMFGSKLKYQCIACNGTKFDALGTCYRCGSKSRKPI